MGFVLVEYGDRGSKPTLQDFDEAIERDNAAFEADSKVIQGSPDNTDYVKRLRDKLAAKKAPR
jgi:hypothetical protein